MTRFNLATPGREATFRNQPGWLSGRFDLFERYCLPTVAAQTEQSFRWIIYLDKHTPDQFRRRIEAAQTVRHFTAYYTENFPAEGWRRSVREEFGTARPNLVLTTVLDNDDGLASDFVSRLHSEVRQHLHDAPCAFNFSNGYVQTGAHLYSHRHSSNAFANVLEDFGTDFRTASDIPHMEIGRHVPVFQIDGPGAWLQVVHGGNVSNKVRGRLVSKTAAQGAFPPEVTHVLADPTPYQKLVDRTIAGPARSGRDLLIRAVRQIRR